MPSRLPLARLQAIAMLDDEEIIPETEMLRKDNAISDASNNIYATDVESTQPPNPTQTETSDLILAPNVSTNQGVTPSLGSRLEKDPGVASGAEGTDDLTIPSQLNEEFSTEFVDDMHVAVGAKGHTRSHSLER